MFLINLYFNIAITNTLYLGQMFEQYYYCFVGLFSFFDSFHVRVFLNKNNDNDE